jgi:hypothetical protein
MPIVPPKPAVEEDMYGQHDDAHASKTDGDDEHEEGEEDSKEFPLPKEILEGKEFNVGDEVVLRITAMHDNQIFVSYAPAKKEDKEGERGMEEPARDEHPGEEGAGDGGGESMY